MLIGFSRTRRGNSQSLSRIPPRVRGSRVIVPVRSLVFARAALHGERTIARAAFAARRGAASGAEQRDGEQEGEEEGSLRGCETLIGFRPISESSRMN